MYSWEAEPDWSVTEVRGSFYAEVRAVMTEKEHQTATGDEFIRAGSSWVDCRKFFRAYLEKQFYEPSQ